VVSLYFGLHIKVRITSYTYANLYGLFYDYANIEILSYMLISMSDKFRDNLLCDLDDVLYIYIHQRIDVVLSQ